MEPCRIRRPNLRRIGRTALRETRLERAAVESFDPLLYFRLTARQAYRQARGRGLESLSTHQSAFEGSLPKYKGQRMRKMAPMTEEARSTDSSRRDMRFVARGLSR